MLHETRYPSCCSNSSAKYRGHAAEHAASRREQVKIPLLVTVAIILRGAAFAGLTARICGERPLVDFQGLTNQLPPTYTMTTSRLPLSSCSRIGFQLSQVPSYGHSNIDLYLASSLRASVGFALFFLFLLSASVATFDDTSQHPNQSASIFVMSSSFVSRHGHRCRALSDDILERGGLYITDRKG